MHEPTSPSTSPSAASTRTLEIVIALLFLMIAGIVIYDSLRLGINWVPSLGPASGTFPFIMGAGLGIASIINLLTALRSGKAGDRSFISQYGLGNVAAVVLPLLAYVAMIGLIGVYVAGAILLFGFMSTIGREPVWKSAIVAVVVPVVAFMMFEKAFLVPLPKGPLEAMFGM